MDSLLNVIRAIIDMLPGRCKTINSSLSMVPSLPPTAFPNSISLLATLTYGERATEGSGSPRGVLSVMLTGNLQCRLLVVNCQQRVTLDSVIVISKYGSE